MASLADKSPKGEVGLLGTVEEDTVKGGGGGGETHEDLEVSTVSLDEDERRGEGRRGDQGKG